MDEPRGMARRDFLRVAAVGAAAAMLPLACDRNAAPPAERAARSEAPRIPTIAKNFAPTRGIIPPLVTPFAADRSVDWDCLDRLIDWHAARGVAGLFLVCGSGELYRLTEEEVVRMAAAAVRRAGALAPAGRVHVLVGGTIHRDPADAQRNIVLARRVADAGVDACFIIPTDDPRTLPEKVADLYHGAREGRRSILEARMLDWFARVHDAVPGPLCAYEMPGGANFTFSPDGLATLGRMERYIGIKDTSTRGSGPDALATVRAKLAAARGTVSIMQANTPHLLESLKIGCTGGINTSANVAPSLFAAMYRAEEAGDLATAERLQERINRVDRMVSRGYMLSAKVALAMMGVPIAPICRQRTWDISAEGAARLREMVALIDRTEREFGIRSEA